MYVRTEELPVYGYNTGNSEKDVIIIASKYEVAVEYVEQDGMGCTVIRLVGEEVNVRKALEEEWCTDGSDEETVQVHVEMLLGNELARRLWNGQLVARPF